MSRKTKCRVCQTSDSYLTMFHFPKDERKLKWCEILDIGVKTVKSSSILCERHFANDQFLNKQKRRLRNDALPLPPPPSIKSVPSTHEMETSTSTSAKVKRGKCQSILPIPQPFIISTVPAPLKLLKPSSNSPRTLAPRGGLAITTTPSNSQFDSGNQQLTFSPLFAFLPHSSTQPQQLQPILLRSSSPLTDQFNVSTQPPPSEQVIPLTPFLQWREVTTDPKSNEGGVNSKVDPAPRLTEGDRLRKVLSLRSTPISTTSNLANEQASSSVAKNKSGTVRNSVTDSNTKQIEPERQTINVVPTTTPIIHSATGSSTSTATTPAAHVLNGFESSTGGTNNAQPCPVQQKNPNLFVPSASYVIIDRATGNVYDGDGKPIYISTQHKTSPEDAEQIGRLTANLDGTRAALRSAKKMLTYTQKKLKRIQSIMDTPIPLSKFEERMNEAFTGSKLLKELIVSQYRRHSSKKERRRQYSNIEIEIASVLYEATGSAGYRTFHRMGMILPTGSSVLRHRITNKIPNQSTANGSESDQSSPSPSRVTAEIDPESVGTEDEDETYEPPSKQRRAGDRVSHIGESSNVKILREVKVQNKAQQKGPPRRRQPQYTVTGSDSQKMYSCANPDCSFTCGVYMTMIKHLRQHPLIMFHCPAPNCSYSTTKKPLLTSHSFTHVQEYSFSCDKCKKRFKSRNAYSVHMKEHRDDESLSKLFECGPRKCKFLTMSAETIKVHRSKCTHLQRTKVDIIDPVVEVVVQPSDPEPSGLQTMESGEDGNTSDADPLQLNDEAVPMDSGPSSTLECISLS